MLPPDFLTRGGVAMSDPVEPVVVPEVPTAQEPEAPVVTIGDIVVSKHWVVTPSGTAPIAGSAWNVTDHRYEAKKHPWWTIVLAIVLFPIGLLFLFITTDETRGAIEVIVTSGTLSTQRRSGGARGSVSPRSARWSIRRRPWPRLLKPAS
jgi:hypothetical protein